MIATTLRMTRADNSALGSEEGKVQSREINTVLRWETELNISKVNLLCLASSDSGGGGKHSSINSNSSYTLVTYFDQILGDKSSKLASVIDY